jgi:hypothetical protein
MTTISTTVQAPRQRKPRQKPQRFVRLTDNPETMVTTLTIKQVSASGKETIDVYTLEEIGSDTKGARGFSLTKEDGTVYNVELDGGFHSCDCKGHERHGHCKHAEALAKLLELRRL